MTATVTYPSNAALTEVAQVITPTLVMDDILFSSVNIPGVGQVGPLMPTENMDATIIMWDQMDDFQGLQQIRGINGQPPKVQPTGANTYIMRPGVYGEYASIDEKHLLERRQYGTFNQPVSIDDLVTVEQNKLLNRRIDRLRYIGWTLFVTGTFSVAHPNGAVEHTDTFAIATASGSDWSVVATATPLGDFRTLQQGGPQVGANFGKGAVAIMNRVTANYLLANTNAADLGGKRTNGLANVLSMTDVNMVFAGEDLPTIVIYDEGYKNDSGTWTRFIPNDKVVLVGRRPANAPVAKYYYTRNAQNDNFAPGPYMSIYDSLEDKKPPREIQVHDGHNGGPAIFYPGSITVVSV